MALTDKERLVTVCGLYCGKCAIFNGDIKNTAKRLNELLRSHGISKEMMSMVPGTEWFNDFEKGLHWCRESVNCGSCRSGKEARFNPMCELRECCIDKEGLDFCFECAEFPCDKINEFEKNFFPCIENLRKIKQVGVSEWIQQQESR